jgi:hypothetical protein
MSGVKDSADVNLISGQWPGDVVDAAAPRRKGTRYDAWVTASTWVAGAAGARK